MGGHTISNDPAVISRHERDRAKRAVEGMVLTLHASRYPYQSPPPTGAQIDATLTVLALLFSRPDTHPIVVAALTIREDL